MAAPEEQPINGDGAAAQEQQPADGEQVTPAHMSLGRGARLLLTGQHSDTLSQRASPIAPAPRLAAAAIAAATARPAACRRQQACLPLTPCSGPARCAAAQVVTPWDVTGGADGKIDYNKLVSQVGRLAS
jgi:hypothetical protein